MMSSTPIRCKAGVLALRPASTDGTDEPFLFALFASTKASQMALMPVDDAIKE